MEQAKPCNCNSSSYNIFRKSLLNFFLPSASKVYNINDTISIKLITRVRLGFSHLREHKFKHNFQETLNPLCSCSIEAESTCHYFLRCHFFDVLWATLMNDLSNIDSDLPTLRDEILQISYYTVTRYMTTKEIKQFQCTYSDILKIPEDLMNLFLIRLKLLLTSYIFASVSLLNTHKL